jgi:hypothetical protein
LLVEEGERAALDFQRGDVKLCSKIKFATQGSTNRAVSLCRIFSVMSELGQKAKYSPGADIFRSVPNTGHPAAAPA